MPLQPVSVMEKLQKALYTAILHLNIQKNLLWEKHWCLRLPTARASCIWHWSAEQVISLLVHFPIFLLFANILFRKSSMWCWAAQPEIGRALGRVEWYAWCVVRG